MKNIGVRTLKTQASAIVKQVREKQEQYVVTYHGRPVGILSPLEMTHAFPLSIGPSAWDKLKKLGTSISAGWKSKKTGVEILSELRR